MSAHDQGRLTKERIISPGTGGGPFFGTKKASLPGQFGIVKWPWPLLKYRLSSMKLR